MSLDLSSARGPGVIGTIMGLIVLIGFGSLALLVLAEDTEGDGKKKGTGLGKQVRIKEGQIESLNNKIAHWEKQADIFEERRIQKKELAIIEGKLRGVQSQLQEAMGVLDAKKERFNRRQSEFEAYVQKYRTAVRANAVGEEMAKLNTKNGKVYHQVKIRKIDALGMNVQHRDGFTRIDFKFLPDDLQKRFQFSEKDALKLKKKEQRVIAASIQGGEEYKVTRKILDIKTMLLTANSEITRMNSEIRRAESDMKSNDSKIDAARSTASRYRSRGNTGLNYDNARKATERANSLLSKNSRLRSAVVKKKLLIQKAERKINDLEAEKLKLEQELRELKMKKKKP